MKKSVSSYIVDNGARLSKIYELAEEYTMEYLHEPELTYLARRRNKIMDDIGEMATEILILRQKLYEAQLDKIIAPLSKNCKKYDKIRAEIERQEKWLMKAGCNSYNVGIAFDVIKSVFTESEVKE